MSATEAAQQANNIVQLVTKTANASEALQTGGGGGTYGSMDIIDAKIAAAEARTDTKFAQVIGKLDHIEQSTGGLRSTIVLTAVAAVGVVFAAMALGVSQFGNGVMVTTTAVNDAQEAKKLAIENAAEVKALRKDIGQFIQAFQKSQPPQ